MSPKEELGEDAQGLAQGGLWGLLLRHCWECHQQHRCRSQKHDWGRGRGWSPVQPLGAWASLLLLSIPPLCTSPHEGEMEWSMMLVGSVV